MPQEKYTRKRPSFDFSLEDTDDLAGAAAECYTDEKDLHHLRFREVSLENESFAGLEISGVIFENCAVTKSSFKKTSFDNVLFKNCDFSSCSFNGCIFNCCVFDTVKGVCADFRSGDFYNVSFENSTFKYANFSASKFNTCAILATDMSETFFAECFFKYVGLDGSKFIRTDFFKTSLNKLDFSTCDLQGICISDDAKELRGAIVSTEQAIALSKFLGITIRD